MYTSTCIRNRNRNPSGLLSSRFHKIVPLWKVGRPSAGVLLPQNFVLFPSGLLTSLRPAFPFPKSLHCSLLASWPAFSRHPPSPKFCSVPFWLVGQPLSQNFVLFPYGKLDGLWQVSSFLKILYCSLLAYWPTFGRHSPSPKVCVVPFWLVGLPLAGILLPKNFVLFPSGLLAGRFPKILCCSLMESCPAFGRCPPSSKNCLVPFWLVGQPSVTILLPQNFVLFPSG